MDAPKFLFGHPRMSPQAKFIVTVLWSSVLATDRVPFSWHKTETLAALIGGADPRRVRRWLEEARSYGAIIEEAAPPDHPRVKKKGQRGWRLEQGPLRDTPVAVPSTRWKRSRTGEKRPDPPGRLAPPGSQQRPADPAKNVLPQDQQRPVDPAKNVRRVFKQSEMESGEGAPKPNTHSASSFEEEMRKNFREAYPAAREAQIEVWARDAYQLSREIGPEEALRRARAMAGARGHKHSNATKGPTT